MSRKHAGSNHSRSWVGSHAPVRTAPHYGPILAFCGAVRCDARAGVTQIVTHRASKCDAPLNNQSRQPIPCLGAKAPRRRVNGPGHDTEGVIFDA
jgi:hypothetical protein